MLPLLRHLPQTREHSHLLQSQEILLIDRKPRRPIPEAGVPPSRISLYAEAP